MPQALARPLVLSLTLAGVLTSSISKADEVDDLLARRYANFEHLEHLRMEMTLDTERPAIKGRPPRATSMRYAFSLTRRSKTNPDPARRFDVTVDILEPVELHLRIEDGQFAFLNPKGKWVSKGPPPSSSEFMAGLSDRHIGKPAMTRAQFDIHRLRGRDNLWGSRKGLEFIPKGRSKLHTRREETVDVQTGQSVVTDLFDSAAIFKPT